tara:strand:+ start:831 stop:1733 length:903 start_codon:yes stop_codon:yes gene_type:complete
VDDNGNWRYEYYYKDHLGNTRLGFSDYDGNEEVDETEITQQNNYYPFGLEHKGTDYGVATQTTHKYLYNSKELQDELALNWLDYGARNYDASVGRWFNVDPLAEEFLDQSPYSAFNNNPILFIDPDGRAAILFDGPGDKFATKVEAANDFGEYYNGTSIVMSSEFGSAIYQNSDGTYSYTIAYIGSQDQTYVNENIPSGTTREGAIHSHGSEDPGYDNNNFSPGDGDKSAAESIGQNEYVVTPSGELKEYDVTTKTSSIPTGASNNIPSDPNSPSRVNTVNAVDTKPTYIDPATNTIHNP